jgi:hypothetical protein
MIHDFLFSRCDQTYGRVDIHCVKRSSSKACTSQIDLAAIKDPIFISVGLTSAKVTLLGMHGNVPASHATS